MAELLPTVRQRRNVLLVLVVAIGVAVVHYTDNYVRYSSYSVSDPSMIGRLITRPMVLVGLVAFTGCALMAWRCFVQGRGAAAAIWMAAYSASGLGSLLHFVDVSPGQLDAFQLGGILADLACGVAVLATAVWLALHAFDA